MTTANPDAWTPLARALVDVHSGGDPRLLIRSNLWEDELVAARHYYRPDHIPLPALERRALARCRGHVLDAGAGAGRHSIELQRAGHQVTALDLSQKAVDLMRARGVLDARQGDLFQLEGAFDTVLMMMHGLGVVGTLHGLGRLLRRLPQLLAPGGQLLADSADLSLTDVEQSDLRSHTSLGGYFGEVEFQVRYGSLQGPPYRWLFVDPDTLTRCASETGCEVEVIGRGERGSFLARIVWAG